MINLKELLESHNPFSATIDNGPENAGYQILGIPTFFCHPYAAREKPSIKNAFQRLRRYILKKSSLFNYSDEEISAIIDKMDNTPRKCLNWRTPKEVSFKKGRFSYQFLTLSVALWSRMCLYTSRPLKTKF